MKIKDLANTISAALFCPLDAFSPEPGAKPNGHMSFYGFAHESQLPGSNTKEGVGILRVDVPNMSSSPQIHPVDVTRENDYCDSHLSLRYHNNIDYRLVVDPGFEPWGVPLLNICFFFI